ncbi:hypothetical protein B9G53_16780 [Pseudanabaena sp. SR411]|uniref:hypothetical protein n=1 Tax=Pseudanabaena sp. SR411 TaxID=1980935 RepID=UPI000B98F12B|nr:hypothetical protein [Pseudanabaena sp. SR411]OYQ63502.1 hypothetical protein B9G53_16780 [Pseudanabaena sp. SR411]
MITIDESNYPIVSVHFENSSTLADTEKYLAHFDKWLSFNQKFGLILDQSTSQNQEDQVKSDPEEIEAVHRLTVEWAKQNKDRITQFCLGMAIVYDGDDLEKRKKAAPKTIAGIFGCLGQVFTSQGEAEQWLLSLQA